MENVGAQFLSLQHVLDRAFCKRELLWIAGAQYHIRGGPVLRIEERIAPDRDRRIGLGDLAELHPDVAFARTVSESMGTPAITITLPIQKPGAPDTLLRTRSQSR